MAVHLNYPNQQIGQSVRLRNYRSFVTLSGGSSAGKTTLAHALMQHLRDRAILTSHDRYYSHMLCGNYDTPEALDTALILSQLGSLRSGDTVELSIYDMVHSQRKAETEKVHPRPSILVEGIFVLGIPEIREQLDYNIFIESKLCLGGRQKNLPRLLVSQTGLINQDLVSAYANIRVF